MPVKLCRENDLGGEVAMTGWKLDPSVRFKTDPFILKFQKPA